MTIYVHGDGGLWRLDAKAQKAVAKGADWYDVGRKMAAEHKFNRRTSDHTWVRLPRNLYADEIGRLGTIGKGVEVYSYDYPDEIRAACQRAVGRRR